MALLSLPVLLSVGVAALTLFITKFVVARKEVWKLQAARVPMPNFHPVFGHFIAIKECIQSLPQNCTFHVVMRELSKQFPNGIFYVNLWPFSKTLMVVATPTVASQVETAFLDKPNEIIGPLERITGGPSLLTMHGSTWKKWRGLFNPGFSASYMIGLASAMADEVALFCDLIGEKAREGKMFQLEEYTLRLTIDIIGRATLDSHLNYQTGESALADSLRTQIYWTQFGTTFNPFRRYLSPRPIVQWYNSRRMNHYINMEIDKRFEERDPSSGKSTKKSPKRNRSIVSLALDQYLENGTQINSSSRKAFKEIAIPQLRLFLYAGHDTTSSTLLYSYYLLSKHSEILAKVRDEHNEVFGTDYSTPHTHNTICENPNLLNQIPYTIAVIKEVLRLFPPSASLREGRPDLVLVDDEGHRYPTENCNIWTLNLVLHHNPKVFVKPEEFLPERWLVGLEDPLYPAKGSWRPFEWGPRSCIGQTLALLELRVALVMTLRKFDITPAYNEWDKLYPKKGIMTVDGNRMYQAEMGGGGAHPADAFPCRVTLRE